jgi:hypothetical protein
MGQFPSQVNIFKSGKCSKALKLILLEFEPNWNGYGITIIFNHKKHRKFIYTGSG